MPSKRKKNSLNNMFNLEHLKKKAEDNLGKKTNYDSIKSLWDPVANEAQFPDDPVKNKHVMGKWKCEKGHFWYETIENRASQPNCPLCHTPRKVTETYNLFYLRPDLAQEWHPTKNKGLTPDEVTPGSQKKAWWFCQKGHEWNATINTRSSGHQCPECTNTRAGRDNNLAVLKPHLAAEWDYEENEGLTPADVVPGSIKKVAWICNKGHQWKARICNRSRGYGCPECSNKKSRYKAPPIKKPIIKTNSFSQVLKKEWHPTKNGLFKIENISSQSNRLAWWKCSKGHVWKTKVYKRSRGSQCPECANQRVGKDNNLAVLRPDLAAEWGKGVNGNLTPYDVVPGSAKIVAWVCNKGHQWKTMVVTRTKGSGCPECANQRVGKDNNLAVLKPDLAAEWDQGANGELTPYDVTPGSHKKVAWICNKGHQWKSVIYKRTKGIGCPECSNQRVGKDNNLAVLKPDLAAEWDQGANRELTPYDVTPGSHKKVAWICNKGHQWKSVIFTRTKGYGCPECSNKKAGKDNNLAVLRPDLAAEWDQEANGNLTPYEVVPGSVKMVAWICIKGHQWKTRISTRAKGSRCHECMNKKAGKNNNLAKLKTPKMVYNND